jgi:hypothetical protein
VRQLLTIKNNQIQNVYGIKVEKPNLENSEMSHQYKRGDTSITAPPYSTNCCVLFKIRIHSLYREGF